MPRPRIMERQECRFPGWATHSTGDAVSRPHENKT